MANNIPNVYFFSGRNISNDLREDLPWWKCIFYHGCADREDKVVAWVLRTYYVDDGLARKPLLIDRNVWVVPKVSKPGSSLTLTKPVCAKISEVAPRVEFLQVVYRHVFEIPWGLGVEPVLPVNVSDEEIVELSKEVQYQTTKLPPDHFELICEAAHRIEVDSGVPGLRISGELDRAYRVDHKKRIDIVVDEQRFLEEKVVFFGGPSLLCTEDVAEILRDAMDPYWFVIERVQAASEM